MAKRGTVGQLLFLCLLGCSFSPDTSGSAVDCTGGKPCPEGWYCPAGEGKKTCIQGTPGGEDGATKDEGTRDEGTMDAGWDPADTLSDVSDPSDRSEPLDGEPGDAGVPDSGGGEDAGVAGDGGCNGCMDPPESSCLDTRTLKTYDTPGTCAGDVCSYTSSTKECYYGCSNGKCIECTPDCAGKECGDDGCGEPCGVCDKAPADYCVGANTVRDYDLSGICPSNKCEYRYTDRNCQYGCQNGACKGCQPDCGGKECGDDGCGGSCGTCNDPPPDYCQNATTLRKYNTSGTCGGTACNYPYTDQNCQWGCANGKCNPCPPNCAGKECGDNGCGGSCGNCQSNYSCSGNTCVWGGQTFEAEGGGMGHNIGRRDGDGWSANTNDDAKGYLLFGPYTTDVPAGARTATWRMMVDNNTADTLVVVRLEVNDHTAGDDLIASRDVRRNQFSNAFQYQDFDLSFSAPGAGHQLEFRVYWNDYAYIKVDKVTVR